MSDLAVEARVRSLNQRLKQSKEEIPFSIGNTKTEQGTYSPSLKRQHRTESLKDVLKNISNVEIDETEDKIWNKPVTKVEVINNSPAPRTHIQKENKSQSLASIYERKKHEESKDGKKSGHNRSRSEFYVHSWDYTPMKSHSHHDNESNNQWQNRIKHKNIVSKQTFINDNNYSINPTKGNFNSAIHQRIRKNSSGTDVTITTTTDTANNTSTTTAIDAAVASTSPTARRLNIKEEITKKQQLPNKESLVSPRNEDSTEISTEKISHKGAEKESIVQNGAQIVNKEVQRIKRELPKLPKISGTGSELESFSEFDADLAQDVDLDRSLDTSIDASLDTSHYDDEYYENYENNSEYGEYTYSEYEEEEEAHPQEQSMYTFVNSEDVMTSSNFLLPSREQSTDVYYQLEGKQRLERSTSSEKKEVIFGKSPDGKIFIKAASPDYLIKSLTRDSVVGNYYYVDIVILTHTTFTDSHTFLDKLIEIFDNSTSDEDEVVKARTVNAIKKWVKFNEVQDDQYLVEKIIKFAKGILNTNSMVSYNWAQQIISDLSKNKLLSPKPDMHFPRLKKKKTALPISLTKKTVDFNNLSFCDIHPLEFSRHITAGDWKYFKKMRPSELMNKAWSGESKQLLAPNVVMLIERFNKLCYWVATEIVCTIHPKQRVLVVERFIDMAKGFLQLKNYHALVAMFTAFNMTCIQKLKSTWKGVSKKHLAVVKEIDNIFDSKANFKVYRSHLKMAQPPIIPFEGIFLSDITFILENPDTIDGLVNFEKAHLLGEIIRTIKTMQNFPYPNLVESAFLNDFLSKSKIFDEDKLYETSLLVRSEKDNKKRDRTNTK